MMRTKSIFSFLVLVLFLQGCKDGYSRGDCEPGYLDVNGKCTLAVGQECDSSGNCLADICIFDQDTGEGFCSISCAKHEDCPSGFFCTYWDDSRCYPGQRPPPCSSDDQCGPCQMCEGGQCLQEKECVLCQDDSGCGPCQRCDDAECIEVAACTLCVGDYQCKTCEICSESRKCEKIPGCSLCNVQSDCPGCTECDRGACIPIEGCGTDPCFNNLDCPERTRCLLDATLGLNVCLPVELGMGEDCSRAGAPQCQSGICIFDENTTGWCSVSCDADDQCPMAYTCQPDEQCVWACRQPSTPPPGNLCEWDADCPDDRVCVPIWNQSTEQWQARCVEKLPCSLPAGSKCGELDQQRCFSGICTSEGYCTSKCLADYQCPVSFLCTGHQQTLSPGLPEASYGGCSPRNMAKFGPGQACPGGNEDCLSGMCLDGMQYGPISVCSLSCVPGEAECPDGFICSELGDNMYACTAALPGGQCGQDDDCGNGEICRLDPMGVPFCGAPNSEGEQAGQPCSNPVDCLSGICLPEGLCSALCISAQNCWDGAWCYPRSWFRDDGRVVWESLCSPDPGSMLPCRKDDDCTGDEICRPGSNEFGKGLSGRCSSPGLGVSFWQPCENSRQCSNGVCVSLGFCSSLCEQDLDCPDGYTCAEMEVEFAENSFETDACRPAQVGLGKPCPYGDEDCLSGECLVPAQGQAYCTISCSSNDDCKEVPEMTCVSDAEGITCRFP